VANLTLNPPLTGIAPVQRPTGNARLWRRQGVRLAYEQDLELLTADSPHCRASRSTTATPTGCFGLLDMRGAGVDVTCATFAYFKEAHLRGVPNCGPGVKALRVCLELRVGRCG
jgi:hypothetical protein